MVCTRLCIATTYSATLDYGGGGWDGVSVSNIVFKGVCFPRLRRRLAFFSNVTQCSTISTAPQQPLLCAHFSAVMSLQSTQSNISQVLL